MKARTITLYADSGNGPQLARFLDHDDRLDLVYNFEYEVEEVIGYVPDYELEIDLYGDKPYAKAEFSDSLDYFGNVSQNQLEKLAAMKDAFDAEPIVPEIDYPCVTFYFAPGALKIATQDYFPNRNKKKKVESKEEPKVEPKEEPNEETKEEPKDVLIQ